HLFQRHQFRNLDHETRQAEAERLDDRAGRVGSGEWGMGSREWVKQLTHRLTPHSLFPTPHSPPSLRTLFICAYEGLTIQTMIAVNERSHQSSVGYRDDRAVLEREIFVRPRL